MSYDEKSLYGQLYGKYAVDIEGVIKGYVYDVDVEIKNGEIYFHLDMYQYVNFYNTGFVEKSKYGPKLKLSLTPSDILSVGRDAIVISYGRIPDMKELEKFKLVMAENDGLKKRMRQTSEELEALSKNLKDRDEKVFDLKEQISILRRKEEEFDLLREELARQKGELQSSREYMKVIDKLDRKISKLLDSCDEE
ncbi:MAG TPA: hypothetical protein PK718_03590 [Candidatus Methanofastidiosa archaeon]|nr:hypothetical protein [Candidatus Methanofastidiosa archaeon]